MRKPIKVVTTSMDQKEYCIFFEGTGMFMLS
jgi:hypothetical protein